LVRPLTDAMYDTHSFDALWLGTPVNVKLDHMRTPAGAVGLAGVVIGLLHSARDYFAAGGRGILIGDRRLPDYGLEKIVEAYSPLGHGCRQGWRGTGSRA